MSGVECQLPIIGNLRFASANELSDCNQASLEGLEGHREWQLVSWMAFCGGDAGNLND
jgi:hypothetical protein